MELDAAQLDRMVQTAFRAPGATDEQVRAEIKRVEAEMRDPRKSMAGRLRGEAFLLRDSYNCTVKARDLTTMQPVQLTPHAEARASRKLQLAELLENAADMLSADAEKPAPPK